MKVFVTGSTGFIGSAVVEELVQAGHEVLGLARSDAGAAKLEAAGAKAHRGTLEDLESLKAGARQANGVIHLAFVHTFPGLLLAVGKDKKAIDALGSVLEGSGRPLVTAGGVIGLRRGELLTEDYAPAKNPRKSESTTRAWGTRGVRASVIRLSPTVHGIGDKAFVPMLVERARKNGAACFVGDGQQRWPGVHRLDAARLFRLALERGKADRAYHGVADEAVPFSDIAAAIGKGVGVPAKAISKLGALWSLGFLGALAAIDSPASSRLTQEELGWKPTHPTLMEDLEAGVYF